MKGRYKRMYITELVPECIEELYGYLMDQEDRAKKDMDYSVYRYNEIRNYNYYLYITKRFLKHRNCRYTD